MEHNIFDKYFKVVLTLMSLCPNVLSYPESQLVEDFQAEKFRELTTEIIFSIRRHNLTGQILVSNLEVSCLGRIDGNKVNEAYIPSVVFGKHHCQTDRAKNATVPSSRYNSPNYVHINAQSSRGRYRRKRRMNELDPNWKTAYSLTVGQHEFSDLPERLQLYDYFVNFDLLNSNKFGNSNNFAKTGKKSLDRDVRAVAKSMDPNNVIWIQIQLQYSPHGPDIHRDFKSPFEQQHHQMTLLRYQPEQTHNFYYNTSSNNIVSNSTSSARGSPEPIEDFPVFYISCGEYCMQEMNILLINNNFPDTSPEEWEMRSPGNETPQRHLTSCVHNENSRLSPTACILGSIANKMNFPVVFSPGEEIDFENSGSSEIFKRNAPFKMVSDNLSRGTVYNSLVFLARKRFSSLDSTMKPFSVVSWLAIAVVCTGAALVFALIKILTMNNTDQSWYDYVVQQMLELMYEERQGRKKFKSDDSCEDDEDRASTITNSQSEPKGKTSKAVLHGTIRIVSFVLVAIYEGKLYNSITFPKARFVSTFDELLTNDKYAVKISREAADVNLYIGSRNYSILNRISETFNIEDCISWVEHSFSHGCIAYDFELRNLPKAQKARMINEEKLFIKSKTSIMTSVRHKPSAILNPAAQISRWILEAGIFQFWMVAENLFTDSLITSKATKRKVFSIKDYLGLFVVYLTLLLIAFLVFTSEVILSWIRKRVQNKSVFDLVFFCWQKIKLCGLRLRQAWWQIKTLFIARQKCCVKLKRIINNIV